MYLVYYIFNNVNHMNNSLRPKIATR